MGYDPKGDQHKEWVEKCNEELESIACQNANDWPLLTREKALSERTKQNPLSWWSICGKAAPKLWLIAMDILGLTTKNKFSAETGKELDDSKLNFDIREIVGNDEIVEDMRTRAESSMANDNDNQNDQDGGIALDRSREQAFRHLDDLRDDDFADEDIPPTANEYDVDFDADDVMRTYRHGSSSM
ncbi:hypothetical protein R1flu_008505 [Riccia fluitans]|uniref:HAT C-terminal dimerisation domain-containing protein n=1 Tax=Riccia fluitans TaxID=41844 RepID=A0ABD1YCJ3_9MARC